MGCKPSKAVQSNVANEDPGQVIGSTIMRADQIVAIGDSAFVPIRDPKSGEDAIMEIHVADKKIASIADLRIKQFDLGLVNSILR